MVLRSLLVAVATSALVLPLAAADLTQPLPPVGLTASQAADGILLTWMPPPVSPAEVVGYTVYRDDGAAVQAIGNVSADQTSYLDAGASGDYVYTYFVTSRSADAESVPSNPAFVEYPHCWDVRDPDCVLPPPAGGLIDTGIFHP